MDDYSAVVEKQGVEDVKTLNTYRASDTSTNANTNTHTEYEYGYRWGNGVLRTDTAYLLHATESFTLRPPNFCSISRGLTGNSVGYDDPFATSLLAVRAGCPLISRYYNSTCHSQLSHMYNYAALYSRDTESRLAAFGFLHTSHNSFDIIHLPLMAFTYLV
jgi:hypothetical protein